MLKVQRNEAEKYILFSVQDTSNLQDPTIPILVSPPNDKAITIKSMTIVLSKHPDVNDLAIRDLLVMKCEHVTTTTISTTTAGMYKV